MRITALLLLLAISAPAAAQQAPPPVALTDVTVHPSTGPTLARATIVIRGGKIRAVGKADPGPGTKRIVLKGMHVYPGLIDADTVLGLVEIGSVKGTQDTQELGQINPNLRAEVSVNADSHLFPVARTGGVLLAHIAPRRGLISGTSAVIATQGWTYEDMTLRAPVFLHVRWPRMRVSQRGRSSEDVAKERRKVGKSLAALETAFREARAYWRARRAPSAGRARDAKWESMRDVLGRVSGRRIRVAVHAETQAQIEAALDWGKRERLELVIVGGTDAWRLARKLKYADVPVILGPQFQLPRRAHEPLELPFRGAARLHAAGVRIAFSTGGNGFSAANARHLRLHAAQAVGYGLPRKAAIRALTLGAAEILSLDQRLGSIEVGKDATLIVTDRPILDDRARVLRAWIAGRSVSLRDKQVELYDRYRKRPRR